EIRPPGRLSHVRQVDWPRNYNDLPRRRYLEMDAGHLPANKNPHGFRPPPFFFSDAELKIPGERTPQGGPNRRRTASSKPANTWDSHPTITQRNLANPAIPSGPTQVNHVSLNT
ncbi:hypothetical protein M3G91_34235, partial [Micromonospora chalcea]|uniref:hypothetical protein n=1 Tax=Micromonospora chalcea TaxID=1874 RepID=UPI0021A7F566